MACPSLQALIELVGCKVNSAKFLEFIAAHAPNLSISDLPERIAHGTGLADQGYTIYRHPGRRGRVECIWIDLVPGAGTAGFDGTLLQGLRAGMKPDDVHQAWGKPTSSGGDPAYSGTHGRTWDCYRNGRVSITLNFWPIRGLEKITLREDLTARANSRQTDRLIGAIALVVLSVVGICTWWLLTWIGRSIVSWTDATYASLYFGYGGSLAGGLFGFAFRIVRECVDSASHGQSGYEYRWVASGKRWRGASVREAYEDLHGRGSYQSVLSAITVVGFLIGMASVVTLGVIGKGRLSDLQDATAFSWFLAVFGFIVGFASMTRKKLKYGAVLACTSLVGIAALLLTRFAPSWREAVESQLGVFVIFSAVLAFWVVGQTEST